MQGRSTLTWWSSLAGDGVRRKGTAGWALRCTAGGRLALPTAALHGSWSKSKRGMRLQVGGVEGGGGKGPWM